MIKEKRNKSPDNEDNSFDYNSNANKNRVQNKRNTGDNIDSNKFKTLEEENTKLKNKIKALEQTKQLAITEEKQEKLMFEIGELKEKLKELTEQNENLQSRYDKKNR